jgi:hypothetical protein
LLAALAVAASLSLHLMMSAGAAVAASAGFDAVVPLGLSWHFFAFFVGLFQLPWLPLKTIKNKVSIIWF